MDTPTKNNATAPRNQANGSQTSAGQTSASQAKGSQANEARVDGNRSPDLAMTSSFTSYTSIEVSNGIEEPETLTEKVVAANREMRRHPTEHFAGGSCDFMLRRHDINPYTTEAPFSASSLNQAKKERT